MSTDYAEKERDFIGSLEEDTGRDLSGWMSAIAESGHRERNAIIDWLRHQGFQFAQASWLERIHHNGGRLIYADTPAAASPARRARPAPPRKEESDLRPHVIAFEPRPRSTVSLDAEVQSLLADAKGLRPLADHILREIAQALPDIEYSVASSFVVMSAPLPFAALLPGAKALRLFADFGAADSRRVKPAEGVNKSAPPFREMLLLDDARNIDEEFLRLVVAAAR